MPRSFVEQACGPLLRAGAAGSGSTATRRGRSTGFTGSGSEKAEERRALYGSTSPWRITPAWHEEIRQRYQRLYTGIFYRRFVLGEWAAAEGLVYDFFDRRNGTRRRCRPGADGAPGGSPWTTAR